MASLLRRQLPNLLLALVAGGLVTALVVTRGEVSTGEKLSRASNVLQAFRQTEIKRLELTRGNETLVLVRGEPNESGIERWSFEQPLNEQADDAEVEDYINTLGFADWSRRIQPDEVDRAQFGLDNPRLVIKLDMGKVQYELKLGKNAVSPADSAYLEIGGQGVPEPGVVIIGKNLVSQLDRDISHFRSRDLVPYVSVALKSLSFEGLGGERRLVRPEGEHAWDGWRFSGMQGDLRVNKQNLDHVLGKLADLNAESFLSIEQARAAQQGASTVTIRMLPKKESSASAVLEVGGDCPGGNAGVVVIRSEPSPLAACVPASVMEGLSTPPEALVDRRPFAVQTDEVERLVVSRGDARLELVREGSGFAMRSPKAGEVDRERGNARIEQMANLLGDIVSNPDLAALGLDKPAGEAVLFTVNAGGTELVENRVFLSEPSASGEVYLLRQQDGGVLKLGKESARLFEPDSTLVRKLSVLSFERRELRAIHLSSRAPDAMQQTIERAVDGSYELVKPAGFGYDAGLVTDLVDHLASLSAERWVSDRDDGSFGLQNPSASVRIEMYPQGDKPAKEHRLRLGAETIAGVYAQLDDDQAVFVLPKRVEQALKTWVVDRSLLMVDPSEVERIKLTRDKKTWVLKKDGARFVLEAGDLDPAQVERIVELLGLLRTESVVQLGAPPAQAGFASPSLLIEVERLPARGERSKPMKLSFGAGDAWRGTSVYYARRDGFNCTFAVARGRVQPILDAL